MVVELRCCGADQRGVAGLELAWNSATGWSYRGCDAEALVALPVPVLAAPHAITALLPALMDGRRGQLPASEDRWGHAEAVVSWAETASVLGEDKYDAAYQRAEEEADGFSQWQAQLDGCKPDEAAVQPTTGHESTEADVARGTTDVTATSEPDPAELGRRAHVNAIYHSAVKEIDHRDRHPNPELFGILTDFFTRAIVFPGKLDPRDGQLHTSDPSRALARLLLQHLEGHGLDLNDVPELELPESSVAPVGEAMAECVAQALRTSRWFSSAVSGTGPAGSQVAFRTVFGADGVLHVAGAQNPAADGTA